MSSIEAVLIQGIRSFGPVDENKAVIKFGSPLTLITGQNGAGKTTVIECLRYVTTGELPPNTRGGGFVHDPKLVGEREVRAVVKLKFRDITSCKVTCHRMMSSIQKPRKLEQKTLDSSLEKETASGEKKKITSRCGEIDKEMVAHLGVSKAILNTVVFCHQEESTWPLAEGKAVKGKFDDIFASTRYTKALENMKKIKLEQGTLCKMYEKELHYLEQQKGSADKLEGDLKESEGYVASFQADIARIKSELEPVDERVQELNQLYDKVNSLQQDIARLESSKEVIVRNRDDLVREISTPFTGSRSDLQLAIDKHASLLERNGRKLTELENKYSILSTDEEEVKGQLRVLDKEYGRLESEDTYHKQRIRERDYSLTKMAKDLEIPGYQEGPYSSTAVNSFLTVVAKHRKDKESKARTEKESYLGRERTLQEQLNASLTNQAQLRESKRLKESTIEDDKKSVAEIKRELAAISMGGAALEEVERQLSVADGNLVEYREQVDLPSLEEALRHLRDDKKKTDDRVQALQGEMNRISSQSAARGILDTLKTQKRDQEQAYQNEMSAIESELLPLVGVMPDQDQDLHHQLSTLEQGKKSEEKKQETHNQREAAQISRLEAQKEELTKQVSEKRRRIEQLAREVAEVTGESKLPFEEAKSKVEKEIQKKMEDISTVKGSESFFRKSLEKIHEKRVCPACARGFDSQDSFEHTVKNLSDRLNKSIPSLLPMMNREVQQLQDKQRRLLELKPKIDELSSLRLSVMPELQKNLESKTQALTKLTQTSLSAKAELAKTREELDAFRKLKPRAQMATRLKTELRDLDERISKASAKIGVGGSMRSHAMVDRDLKDAQRSADEMNRKLDHKRQEISEAQQALRGLEDDVHKLKEEKLTLQAKLQKREQLVSEKGKLTVEIENLSREIKTLANKLGPVEDRIHTLTEDKAQLARERESAESATRYELDKFRNSEDNLRKRTTEIVSYFERGADKELGRCQRKVSELQSVSEAKSREKKKVEDQALSIRKDLANAQVQYRELEDNMKLMDYKEEISRKEKKFRSLKSELRSMGLDQYDEEYRRCQEKSEQLRKDKARYEGQCDGKLQMVRSLKGQLSNDMYKNISKKFRDKQIDLKTTEAASSDLEKCYRALDRAITRFHTLKMAEINKILKELWIKTYKGGDIDCIKICSEDTGTGASISQRRVYNYRVVMVKGQTELDMRGRCSAGQKMLASILIRLALAETFCLNCGLLVLDEPTTNLDHSNMEGLAHSLIDIIRERSRSQKNFQLIIITHDQDFVEILGQAGFTDCYFRVSKEVGESSRIYRHFFRGATHTRDAH